jgi:hypothetical protein
MAQITDKPVFHGRASRPQLSARANLLLALRNALRLLP